MPTQDRRRPLPRRPVPHEGALPRSTNQSAPRLAHRSVPPIVSGRQLGDSAGVDGAEVLRAVRRREGLSQRALAARAGVAVSTLAAVEAGRRPPSIAVVTAVLAVAGLELAVDLPVPEVTAAGVAHLHRSLEQRLHLAVGGDGRPRHRAQPVAWTELQRLTAQHHVHLHGRTARAVWLHDEPAEPVEACASPRRAGASRPAATSCEAVEVVPPCERRVRRPVRVGVGHWQVSVDPPADLALDAVHAARRGALRAVARLLHEQAALDAAGRRTRAHRDPDHARERTEVFHTKRFHRLEMPPGHDTRSWRLDDDASLVAWLRRYDHPV